MKIELTLSTPISCSVRARQVRASFDVPDKKKDEQSWDVDFPIETRNWGVGLIVGPSGSGKTTVMRHVFGEPRQLKWRAPSVVDDFDIRQSVVDITEACGAVGFNTIPAWLRPYKVLSNGEKFRVELARRLLEHSAPVVVDEFTSLVDRQVAKIASHAAQKYARRIGKQFVGVTCHYDVEDWLQPDWVLDMAKREFRWRSLQQRPTIEVELARVAYAEWKVFAPFHYLTADLNPSAKCFALKIAGRSTAFAGVLHFPHPKVRDVRRLSRLVTLPDWQGLGLAMRLSERLGAAYKATGKRFRTYPAHRALIRAFSKGAWRQVKEAGKFSPTNQEGFNSTLERGAFGGRPCAVFEYAGDAWNNVAEARALVEES